MLSLTIMLAAGLLLPTEASACHHYSRWYYPQPQRCGVARQMVRFPTPQTREKKLTWPDIALPSLAQADLDGGGADEPTRARLLLRAALEAANAH
jgi:hypothetical protein